MMKNVALKENETPIVDLAKLKATALSPAPNAEP
jgi:hypothetical protein